MATAVLIAVVVGGGVLLVMRRLFPRQNTVKLLQYPAGMMRGKTVIVTGANSGIGKALAGELLKLQARVIMACRDRQSAAEAARDIRGHSDTELGELVIKQLDLASLQSVRTFCQEIQEVSCLVSASSLTKMMFLRMLTPEVQLLCALTNCELSMVPIGNRRAKSHVFICNVAPIYIPSLFLFFYLALFSAFWSV